MWGIGLRWLRDRKVVEDYRILHGLEETDEYRLSPIRATIERGTPFRRRLDRPVLGSRAQGVFGRASPAHDRPARGSHATLCWRGYRGHAAPDHRSRLARLPMPCGGAVQMSKLDAPIDAVYFIEKETVSYSKTHLSGVHP